MQTRMKSALPIVYIVISLTMSSLAYAKAILGIVPTSTTLRSIKIASNGSTTLIYTVTNNTKIPLNQLIIDPYYNTNSSLSLTVQNNHCTGTLASGASCTFELLIKGSGRTITATLMPRVCEFNSATCSVPILSNRMSLSIGALELALLI